MERYIGTDPQLVYAGEGFGTVDQLIGELADVSCNFEIVVCGGEDAQLLELFNHLKYSEQPGPVTEAEFRRYNLVKPLKRKGVNKGKGQRKANRKDRWK